MLEKMSPLLSTILLLSPLLSLVICTSTSTKEPSINNQNHTTTLPEVALSIAENKSSVISLVNDSDTESYSGNLGEGVTEEPLHVDVPEPNIDTTSIGIRSFTVEITKDEKRSTSTTAPNKTEQETSNSPSLEELPIDLNDKTFSTSLVSDKNTTESPPSVELNQQPRIQETSASTISSHSTLSPHEDNVLNSNFKILFENENTQAVNEMRFNRAEPGSQENEISNEEKAEKKLYRTKIGEITTGDFDLEINIREPQDQRHVNKDRLPSDIPVHHEQLKVNIDDFFPSNVEDFKPFIEISNQKILKEKNILHNEKVNQQLVVNSEGVKSGTRINTSNSAKTTNIEIELIDNTSSPSGDDKMIQIDEVITQVKDAVTDNSFIPRRVKKLNPTLKTNGKDSPRIHDFGMTKFNPDKPRKTEKNQQVSGNSEFSTTKFYNSKQSLSDVVQSKSSPTSSSLPSSKSTLSRGSMNSIKDKTTLNNKASIQTSTTKILKTIPTTSRPHILSRFQEKLNLLDCDLQNFANEMTVWRGNETHELNLPMTVSLKIFLY